MEVKITFLKMAILLVFYMAFLEVILNNPKNRFNLLRLKQPRKILRVNREDFPFFGAERGLSTPINVVIWPRILTL